LLLPTGHHWKEIEMLRSYTTLEVRYYDDAEEAVVSRIRLNGRFEAYRGSSFDEPVRLAPAAYTRSLERLLKAAQEAVESITARLDRGGAEGEEAPFGAEDVVVEDAQEAEPVAQAKKAKKAKKKEAAI
jgi:hypothetical protein